MNPDIEAKEIADSLGLTLGESQYLRLVARFETYYGRGWGKGKSDAGQGSNNWGAVTVSCDSETPKFRHKDSSYERGEYETCFRVYSTPREGAAHLAQVLLKPNVKAAIASGNLKKAVSAQYSNSYFAGMSQASTQAKRDAENIQAYTDALRRSQSAMIANTEEPNLFTAKSKSSGWLWISGAAGAAGLGLLLSQKR